MALHTTYTDNKTHGVYLNENMLIDFLAFQLLFLFTRRQYQFPLSSNTSCQSSDSTSSASWHLAPGRSSVHVDDEIVFSHEHLQTAHHIPGEDDTALGSGSFGGDH